MSNIRKTSILLLLTPLMLGCKTGNKNSKQTSQSSEAESLSLSSSSEEVVPVDVSVINNPNIKTSLYRGYGTKVVNSSSLRYDGYFTPTAFNILNTSIKKPSVDGKGFEAEYSLYDDNIEEELIVAYVAETPIYLAMTFRVEFDYELAVGDKDIGLFLNTTPTGTGFVSDDDNVELEKAYRMSILLEDDEDEDDIDTRIYAGKESYENCYHVAQQGMAHYPFVNIICAETSNYPLPDETTPRNQAIGRPDFLGLIYSKEKNKKHTFLDFVVWIDGYSPYITNSTVAYYEGLHLDLAFELAEIND